MRGSNKAFFLIFILLTPTLSSRRGSFFLNLMVVTPERGNYWGLWGIYCELPWPFKISPIRVFRVLYNPAE